MFSYSNCLVHKLNALYDYSGSSLYQEKNSQLYIYAWVPPSFLQEMMSSSKHCKLDFIILWRPSHHFICYLRSCGFRETSTFFTTTAISIQRIITHPLPMAMICMCQTKAFANTRACTGQLFWNLWPIFRYLHPVCDHDGKRQRQHFSTNMVLTNCLK